MWATSSYLSLASISRPWSLELHYPVPALTLSPLPAPAPAPALSMAPAYSNLRPRPSLRPTNSKPRPRPSLQPSLGAQLQFRPRNSPFLYWEKASWRCCTCPCKASTCCLRAAMSAGKRPDEGKPSPSWDQLRAWASRGGCPIVGTY